MPTISTRVVSADTLQTVIAEREIQIAKWGEQNHDNLYWLGILTEETGELAKELIEHGDLSDVYVELSQVAAVSLAWMDAIRRQSGWDGD